VFLACKKYCSKNSQNLFFGIDRTLNDSGSIAQLNKQICVVVVAAAAGSPGVTATTPE